MKKIQIELIEIKLIGIKVRTNNEAEWQPMEGKIFPCIQRYFHQQLFEKIPDRTKPGTTYCAYTDYESDYTGDYTYFIGEEVSSLKDVPEGFEKLIIPPQHYAKFTTGPGPMPGVVRDAWQEIWKMSPKELGGPRNYQTDFEIYDERASDHDNIVLDINIGIEIP